MRRPIDIADVALAVVSALFGRNRLLETRYFALRHSTDPLPVAVRAAFFPILFRFSAAGLIITPSRIPRIPALG
jgi:hypothetical protein